MYEKSVVYVSNPSDVPKVKHWALIQSTSRDDGYGGRAPATDYVAYTDRADLMLEVKRLTTGSHPTTFRVIEVTPLEVQVDVVLSGAKETDNAPSGS